MKTCPYLFLDLWEAHEQIGTNIKKWGGPKIGKVWRGVCRVLDLYFWNGKNQRVRCKKTFENWLRITGSKLNVSECHLKMALVICIKLLQWALISLKTVGYMENIPSNVNLFDCVSYILVVDFLTRSRWDSRPNISPTPLFNFHPDSFLTICVLFLINWEVTYFFL